MHQPSYEKDLARQGAQPDRQQQRILKHPALHEVGGVQKSVLCMLASG
jgi:hypothetical protein